jgi:hypothetical protein
MGSWGAKRTKALSANGFNRVAIYLQALLNDFVGYQSGVIWKQQTKHLGQIVGDMDVNTNVGLTQETLFQTAAILFLTAVLIFLSWFAIKKLLQ